MLMYKSKSCVPCCSLMVEKVDVCTPRSRYTSSFMNFIDKHCFSSELQAEVCSDSQSVGGNKWLEGTCLEEAGTAVWFIFWFISGVRLLKVKVVIVEVEWYLRVVKLIFALAGFLMGAFALRESRHLGWSQFAASAKSSGVRLLQR